MNGIKQGNSSVLVNSVLMVRQSFMFFFFGEANRSGRGLMRDLPKVKDTSQLGYEGFQPRRSKLYVFFGYRRLLLSVGVRKAGRFTIMGPFKTALGILCSGVMLVAA